MKLFKRSSNPIFVEEEGYNWANKRSKGFRIALLLMTLALIAVTAITMVNA